MVWYKMRAFTATIASKWLLSLQNGYNRFKIASKYFVNATIASKWLLSLQNGYNRFKIFRECAQVGLQLGYNWVWENTHLDDFLNLKLHGIQIWSIISKVAVFGLRRTPALQFPVWPKSNSRFSGTTDSEPLIFGFSGRFRSISQFSGHGTWNYVQLKVRLRVTWHSQIVRSADLDF